MTTAAVFFFLSMAAVTGYALVRFVHRGLSRAEIVAWSFAAGLLVQAVIEVSLFAVGLLPGPKEILFGEAVLIAGSLVLRRRSNVEPPPDWHRSSSSFPVPLLVLAAVAILLFFCLAMTEPVSAPDFLAIWGLKGRVIFATASIPSRLFHDPALFWAHPEYPLLVPLSFAALASAARAWDDRALALFYPFCQVATVLALWGFLARHTSKEAGSVAACLAAACFPLYAAGNVGTAEIPLALGFVLGSCAALEAGLEDSPATRTRVALASLFCATTKQEGTLFALLLAAMMFWTRRRSRGGSFFLVAALPVLFHAALLRLLRGPVIRRDFDLALLAPRRWGEFLSRLGLVGGRLISVELFKAVVPVSAILVFLLVSKRGPFDRLLWLLAAQMLVYAAVCALSAFGPVWLIETSFSRLTITLFPAITLVLCSRLTRSDGSHTSVG